MLKLITDENLTVWQFQQPRIDLANIMFQLKQWADSLGDSWYDDIIYQTLDRAADIVLDNVEE